MTDNHVISMKDFEETAYLLPDAFQDFVDGNRRPLIRQLRWWDEHIKQLDEALKSEEENYRTHPDDYFLPYDEIAYVVHWRKQLKIARKIRLTVHEEVQNVDRRKV